MPHLEVAYLGDKEYLYILGIKHDTQTRTRYINES